MKPLNGSHFINIFSHYRPVGDPQWFAKPNPPGTPEPLIDIGECHLSRSHCDNPEAEGPACRPKVLCEKANLPTLSPQLEIVKGEMDLFNYWQKYSHKVPPDFTPHPPNVGTTPLSVDHSEL